MPPRPRPTRGPTLAIFALVFLVLATACNVIRLRERRLHREFERAGLRAEVVEVGPDRVHAWTKPAPERAPVPVLMIHGFGGSAVWQWAEQLPVLAPSRGVIVPDLLWFGDSSSTKLDYTLDHQASALTALLDHHGAQRVDIVGISYGGLVGYLIARHHPDRVRTLVLVDSPGPVYTSADHAALLGRFGAEQAADIFLPRDEDDVRTLIEALAYFDPPWTPRFALRQAQVGLYEPHAVGQRSLLADLESNLSRYAGGTVPGVEFGVIWGDEDPVFPLAIGRRVAVATGAPLRVIPRARHAPNLEHPRAFNDALLEVLDGA